MGKRRNRQSSGRQWFSHFGQYLLLSTVAAITIFLVVLAFNRPMSAPTNGTVRTPAAADTVDSDPTPTPTSAPLTVAFRGDSYTAGGGSTAVDNRWTTQLSSANGWTEVNAGVDGTGYGTAAATTDALP